MEAIAAVLRHPEPPADAGAISALLRRCFPGDGEARLVQAGLEAARQAGQLRVVVLGAPDFHGRFGFTLASSFGLMDANGDGVAFQVLALQPGAIPQGGGLVSYGPEFALVS